MSITIDSILKSIHNRLYDTNIGNIVASFVAPSFRRNLFMYLNSLTISSQEKENIRAITFDGSFFDKSLDLKTLENSDIEAHTVLLVYVPLGKVVKLLFNPDCSLYQQIKVKHANCCRHFDEKERYEMIKMVSVYPKDLQDQLNNANVNSVKTLLNIRIAMNREKWLCSKSNMSFRQNSVLYGLLLSSEFILNNRHNLYCEKFVQQVDDLLDMLLEPIDREEDPNVQELLYFYLEEMIKLYDYSPEPFDFNDLT